jgi:hypothetical protein
MTFTIANEGTVALSGNVSSGCPEFEVVSGGGAYTLEPQETQTVIVEFNPTGCGVRTCSIETGSACCPDVACVGIGGGGRCSVSVTTLDFGTVLPGQTADRSFTITNEGCEVLSVSPSSSSSEYSILQGGGSHERQVGQPLEVTVRFQSVACGARGATIDIGTADCEGVTCEAVVAGSHCALEPDTLGFGEVEIGEQKDLTFDIANAGCGPISGLVSTTCPDFSIVGAGDYYLSPAGQNCLRALPADGCGPGHAPSRQGDPTPPPSITPALARSAAPWIEARRFGTVRQRRSSACSESGTADANGLRINHRVVRFLRFWTEELESEVQEVTVNSDL